VWKTIKSEIRTAIILVGVIVVGVASLSVIFSTLETSQNTILNTINEESGLKTQFIDKSKFKKAPELVGISGYINTTPEELEKAIEGKVVLYDIWTYSCINCIRTLPFLTAWDEKYSDEGLLIIGVHSPEFEFEKDITNVQMAVDKYGIKYPVVLDNDKETWKAFNNRYWPHKFISDNENYIRYDHIGEGAFLNLLLSIDCVFNPDSSLIVSKIVFCGVSNVENITLIVATPTTITPRRIIAVLISDFIVFHK